MARKKSKANYFTKETEEYIVKFNVSSDQDYRSQIFTDHIYYPFYKLAENIIHTFKFYYTDVEKRQDEHLLPRLRFIDTNGVDTQHLLNEIGDTKFIVGPLLKDTVESLIPNLPVGVNVLALNRPEELAAPAALCASLRKEITP